MRSSVTSAPMWKAAPRQRRYLPISSSVIGRTTTSLTGRLPLLAAYFVDGEGGRHGHVKGTDLAELGEIRDVVTRSQRGRTDAVILVADHQARGFARRGLVQWASVVSELDGDDVQTAVSRRRDRVDGLVESLDLEEAVGPERRLAHARDRRWWCRAAAPHGLDAVGGGRAQDRADVVRALHTVEHQRQPRVGAPAPLAVEPLQTGRVERLHVRLTSSTR